MQTIIFDKKALTNSIKNDINEYKSSLFVDKLVIVIDDTTYIININDDDYVSYVLSLINDSIYNDFALSIKYTKNAIIYLID